MNRTPPHSIEAEKGVLGSMIVNPSEAIPEASRHLNQFHFYNPVHRTIFETLVETHQDEGGIDLIIFTQALRDRGKLEEVGGPGYVTEIQTFVPLLQTLVHTSRLFSKNMLCVKSSLPAKRLSGVHMSRKLM